jgi:hypothetical protein
MTTHANSDDFDIGKAIFEKLKDLPHERQQRVLRWVSEGLGTTIIPSTPAQVAPATSNLGGGSPLPTPAATIGTDIRSFVTAKAPKSDNQFAAVVAYYYRFDAPPAERRESIGADQLQEAARLAGRKRLSKPLKTLNNAKAMGYLDGASGEYSINSVGENLVAMTLPGMPENRTRTPRTRKNVKKQAKL